MKIEIVADIAMPNPLISDVFSEVINDIIAFASTSDLSAVDELLEKYNKLADKIQSKGYNDPIYRLEIGYNPLLVISGDWTTAYIEYSGELCVFCGKKRNVTIRDILPFHDQFKMPLCNVCSNKHPEYKESSQFNSITTKIKTKIFKSSQIISSFFKHS